MDGGSLARGLFEGRLSPATQLRAHRLKAMMARILGPEPPMIPADLEPPPKPGSPFARLRMAAAHRRGATKAAEQTIDAFLARDFARIEKHAQDSLHVLWPNGALMKHKRDVLLSSLASRPGSIIPAAPRRVRAYAVNELRSLLPAGVAESIAALFGAPNGILVTAALDDRRGTQVRVAVMTSPDGAGKWRAHNLPLPTPDDAVRIQRSPKVDEDEALVVADRFARHMVLGHVEHVRSLRNRAMDRVLFGDEVIEAEALPRRAEEDFDPAERLEIVFLSTARRELAPALRDRVRARAKEAWRMPFESLRMRSAVTEMAPLDPDKGDIENARSEVVSLLLGVEERETLRWRLGGLFF